MTPGTHFFNVMDHGCVVGQGTYDELIAKNGFYAHRYNSRFSVWHKTQGLPQPPP